MTKTRLTITVDTDIVTKLRKQQAVQIEKTDKSCSLSEIINSHLSKSVK